MSSGSAQTKGPPGGDREEASIPPLSTSVAPATVDRAPAEWLDRLLDATNQLPLDASLAEVAHEVLAAVSPSLPGAALGVCTPDGRGGTVVVRVGGEAEADHPARLFPSRPCETVHPVPRDEGTTLHVASDDQRGPPPPLLERLLATLGAALCRARAADARGRTADLRELEERMIHTERTAGLGQIAAGIVHDLNTPLTTVVAYADVLRKKWSQDAGVDEADRLRLVRIHEAAERLLSFSRDLMTYARPSPHVPAPVDVKDVLERALAFCEHAITTSRVLVERDFEEVRPVRGVSGQLVQVFVNLVTNACQAVAQDGTGRLTLVVRPGAVDSVVVTVADDGAGLPAEAQRLFEPFFTTKDGGTGLGLAIVHRIVATHGGSVRAERRSPRGTAFIVDLPLAARASDPA